MEETVLAGWGTWAGPGMDIVKTKANTDIKYIEGTSYQDRKDFNSNRVIINENTPSLDPKYKVNLPYGYTEEEYRLKMSTPVSREMNPMRIFKKLVKPSIDKVSGAVIEPFVYDPEE